MEKDDIGSLEGYKEIAISIFIIVVGFYVVSNILPDFTIEANENWGPIGDFIGGLLNPIFSLIALFALLATIKLQIKELNSTNIQLKNSQEELNLTREEVGLTRKATEESSKALIEQSNSIKIQNFENTFFNMLNLHREITNNLSLVMLKKYSHIPNQEYERKAIATARKKEYKIKITYYYTIQKTKIDIVEDKDYLGREVISKLFEIFENYIKICNEKNKGPNLDINNIYGSFYKEYNEIIGHYFRNIYQILKFIEKQDNEELIDKKFYTNILRAQLSNSELALLLINATSKFGTKKLLPLLIKYEFMEPLPILKINNLYLKKITTLCIARTNNLNKQIGTNYHRWNIFGKKREWKSYINRFFKK